jgi:hypothetical protein
MTQLQKINEINEYLYFKSKNVKVFPCSYRGVYTLENKGTEKDNSFTFDPESRLTTEGSFTNIPGYSIGYSPLNKNSYIISYTTTGSDTTKTGLLKCVIGGYYFEINNITIEDLEKLQNKKLVIKHKDIPLVEDATNQKDSNRITHVLDS